MTGQNLQEGMQWIVQDARDRMFIYSMYSYSSGSSVENGEFDAGAID